jgi:hypothetical protein
MSTALKQRINITADKEMQSAIKVLAKRDSMPISAKAAQLIRVALELEEDLILGEIATMRSKQRVKYIPHEVVWESIK